MSPLRSTARALALGATLTVVFAGCGSKNDNGSTSSSAPAATSTPAAAPASSAALTPQKGGAVQVAYKNYSIDPADITVKVGTKIVWTNYDSSTHNVIVKDGAPEMYKSADFGKGKSVTFTPTKPGVYQYLCTFHAASMQGKITVQG